MDFMVFGFGTLNFCSLLLCVQVIILHKGNLSDGKAFENPRLG
jgi:hypothetical protein